MRRLITCIFSCFFIMNYLYSQDLVITKLGKQYDCKILSIDSTKINIKTEFKGSEITTFIFLDNVEKYFFDYKNNQQAIDENRSFQSKNDETNIDTTKINTKPDYPTFRLSVSGGLGKRYAEVSNDIDAEFKDFIEKLKKGNCLDIEAVFFSDKSKGYGLKYSQFNASNSIPIYRSNGVGTENSNLKDKIQITFIGPVFYNRFVLPSNTAFFNIGSSIGLLNYTENASAFSESNEILGSTLGLNLSIGFDFLITKNIGVGIDGGVILGSLSKIKVNGDEIELKDNERENLGRFQFTIGLRFFN